MSYCKKYNMHPSVALCLACEECYPPGERVNGRMCGYEVPLRSGAELLEYETERRLKADENPPEVLSPFAAVRGLDVPESVRVISPEQIHENLYKYRFLHQLRDILSEMLDEYGEDPDRMKDSIIEKYEPMIYKHIIGEYEITAEVSINTDRELVLTREQRERLAKIINNDTGTGK